MDFGKVDTRKWFLGAGVFVAVLFTVINPEGSAPVPFPVRLVQWLLNVFISLAIIIAVHGRLNQWTGLAQTRPWLALTVSGLVGALLFSPAALALDVLFGDNTLGDPPGTQWLDAWLDEWTGVTQTALLVWLGMNAPAVLGLDFDGRRRQRQGGSGKETSDTLTTALAPEDTESPGGECEDRKENHVPRGSAGSTFLELLPERIGTDIAWMKSELHYLRVVTTRGKALVLFNLGDAADGMPESAGVMAHRSYWVAYAHVERLVTSDGKSELLMKDGTRIPVARRRRAEVRRRIGS
jgi:hypothetical protein